MNTNYFDNYINLNEVENQYSRVEFYRRVARLIKCSTLDYVNAHSKEVHPKISFYSKYGKRFLDIVISLLALIFTLPCNLLIAIITFFDVGCPIIFKQQRLGKNGKEFTLVKFRNMTNEQGKNGELLPAEQRVTKFGYFVRRTSLDELLNFWSILKGDMSLIGPRPLEIVYNERYSERHKMRMAVRPGLECPLLYDIDHKITWYEQFENDIYYVENLSFFLDVKMFFRLVKMVFDKKNNSMRGASMRGGFMGYSKDGMTINSQSVPIKYVEDAVCMQENEKQLILAEGA
ncbi:MAG: sugar transferase [Lachnospiraceae bacterium]|nr:sugar transferase [Lachnospiraceae bacterium]